MPVIVGFQAHGREPGQARKGAATAVDSCAGMWLVGPSPFMAATVKISVKFPLLIPSQNVEHCTECGSI